MKQSLYYLHTKSSLHVGIGQNTGIIDLPIAREKASNLPQVPGSTVKGVLRYELTNELHKDDLLALFGPETGDSASEYAGALAVGDARLLCLPIRSWYGTFAWATCPMILRRYQRDLDQKQSVPVPKKDGALHTTETELIDNKIIYLEDLDIAATHNAETDKWAENIALAFFSDNDWQDLFKQRFVILPDNIFNFLAETATEIRARIRIQEKTRTVQSGALWYEEYLPAETLLWGCVASDRSRKQDHKKNNKEMMELLPKARHLQIGGNATVGAGRVKWLLQTQVEVKQ